MGTAISNNLKNELEFGAALQIPGKNELFALLSLLKGQPDASQSTLVPSETNTTTWNVLGTLKDAEGNAVAKRIGVMVYLSDDANGDSLASAGGGFAIGTNGVLIGVLTTNHAYELVTEANGVFDIDITEAGADVYYMIVKMPNGELLASTALTFEA